MKSINIFGDIIGGEAERWFESEVTPQQIVDELKAANGEPIEVNINSNGGDVAGGLAIANALKGYKGEVTCNVLGLAASMASVIACAGKRLCMGQGAFLMIHNPWTVTMGNAEDLRKDAATLDKMRDSIVTFYQSKSTKTAEELKELMDAETWISREMANDFGFEVEDYEGELKAAASLSRRAFAKAPDAAKALVQFKAEKPTAQEPAPEAPEAPAPTPETPAGAPEAASEPTPAPEGNWEERFKGLSKKFNAAQKAGMEALAQQEAKFKAEIEARDAQIKDFKSQLETSAKDLADANAKVSELSAKLDESTKALQTANADLAQTRDSLQKAEDKAAELEKTRDLLTAGVLTPAPEGSTYAEKMKAAKTPEERENLRAQKRAGKIK
jgi:ATP-dependent Clp endopeptidase proteolytic subunit ClpP